MRVRSLMSSDVSCCRRETPLQEVARLMIECDCGEIPVCDESGRVLGVVTDRDIACRTVAKGRNPLELRAGDCMTAPAVVVSDDATLEDACALLEDNQVRRLPVVDDTDRCIGMISVADVSRFAPRRTTAMVVERISEPSIAASATAR
jgi:CBS domain-containing protein